MARDGLSLQAAQSRIDAQMDLAEKCQRAHCLLDNSGSKAQLFGQIDAAIAASSIVP